MRTPWKLRLLFSGSPLNMGAEIKLLMEKPVADSRNPSGPEPPERRQRAPHPGKPQATQS
jgi:hypothetical protein